MRRTLSWPLVAFTLALCWGCATEDEGSPLARAPRTLASTPSATPTQQPSTVAVVTPSPTPRPTPTPWSPPAPTPTPTLAPLPSPPIVIPTPGQSVPPVEEPGASESLNVEGA